MRHHGRLCKKIPVDGDAVDDILAWDGSSWASVDITTLTATGEAGTAAGQMLFWDGTTWVHTEVTELYWDDTTKILTTSGITVTGNSVFGLNSSVFQPATDSTTFFQILDADGGTPVFNVDTTNERVGINMTGAVCPLEIPGSTTNSSAKFGSYEIQSYAVNNSWLTDNLYYDGIFKHRSNGFGVMSYWEGGSYQIRTAPTRGAGLAALLERRFIVDNVGNVAIGGSQVSYVDFTGSSMVVLADGKVGIGEIAPETLTEWTSTVPYLTLHNSTHEDTDGGRESRINFKGEQGVTPFEETTLARIEASHDGTGADDKGKIVISINDGDDGDTPTKILRINSNGLFTDRWLESDTNTFLGISVCGAGNLDTGGAYNTAIGYKALEQITIGSANTVVGNYAGNAITTGTSNIGFGGGTLFNTSTGGYNIAIGTTAGYTGNGSKNIFLGFSAGYYETGSDKLFIDNLPRTDEADARIKALIYGVMADAPADQSLRINAEILGSDGAKIGDGGTTNYSQFANNGILTMEGTGRVIRHYYLQAGSFTKKAASTPTIGWIDDFETWDFATAPGQEQDMFFTMNVPYRHDATATINVEVIWTYDVAAADEAKFVRWGLDYTPVANGETVAGAATIEIKGDAANLNVNAGKLRHTDLETGMIPDNITAHDQVSLRFYRDTADDDYGNVARLVGVHITFTMDKLGLAI